MKKVLSFVLAAVLAVTVSGCAGGVAARDLMEDVTPGQLDAGLVAVDGESAAAPANFALRLFQACSRPGENTMISPMSVLCALAMTANGAEGDTLAQMEEVLGMTVPELNAYMKAYMDGLPEGERYKLRLANSLWLTDDKSLSVDESFLQANGDYYGADIYQIPFDAAACETINGWVSDHTDGMIGKVVETIPPETVVMYLINALSFDAEWQDIYKDIQIFDGVFTTENGERQEVEMMRSQEGLYLSDGNAVGFVKHYADCQYAFVALLPEAGTSVRDYAAALTGQGLTALLSDTQQCAVRVTMPKFESECSVELREVLIAMGMADAFDEETADFSGLGTLSQGNIFIDRVVHKAYIAVDEKGTKAGAVTAVAMGTGDAPEEEVREVVLDRPFLYMVIDCRANLPLFMGILADAD